MGCSGGSFAYQTLLLRPRGSRVLFFNRLRLTPMQMEQMPNSNKSALERARICGSHCCEGRFQTFHTQSSAIVGSRGLSIWGSVLRKEGTRVGYCVGGRLKCYFAFVEYSITSLARLPVSDRQLSAIKISCLGGLSVSPLSFLPATVFICKYIDNRLTIRLF